MNNPLVSVIVPCFNQAQYLDEALQSVLDQTYKNWECIIVNDGSPDNTEEIAKLWIEKDERFIYLYKENGGLSSARNAGIDLAKGEYIQFLDSDDLLNKYKIELSLAGFNDAIDIVICDYFPFDQHTDSFVRGRYLSPFPNPLSFKTDIVKNWESQLSIPCHCVLFRAKLLNKKTILFDKSMPNHEDWVFWVQIFYNSKGIFNLQKSLTSYRIHNESMCTDTTKMRIGYDLACEKNVSFFEKKNETELVKICIQRIKPKEAKKSKVLPKALILFIPPIILILVKKLRKKCQKKV